MKGSPGTETDRAHGAGNAQRRRDTAGAGDGKSRKQWSVVSGQWSVKKAADCCCLLLTTDH
jgi:hypothetical protein